MDFPYSTPEQHRDTLAERFIKFMKPKYDAGQKEHGGFMWENLSPEKLIKASKEEAVDLWNYLDTLEDKLSVEKKYAIKGVLSMLIDRCFTTAKEKGWWDKGVNPAEKIALMHSELSEALEEYRKDPGMPLYEKDGKPEGVVVELADCIIRIFDFCGKMNLPIVDALMKKMDYNETRPYRHGGKSC